MAKRVGKYKVTKREESVTLLDGGTIDGVLTRRTPETIIDWNYIECPTPTVSLHSGAGGAQGVLADGELFSMIFGGKNGQTTACQVSHVGAYTAAGSGYFVEGTIPAVDANGTVAGLNLQGDAATADNTGIEMIIGGTQFGGYAACTIGTHAMVFDATFNSVDFTDQDAVTIGFRKIEEFEVGHGAILAAATGDPLYTDFVAFGVVTYEHVGASVSGAGTLAAPATTAAYTFDDGDVVVPYLVIQNTNQDSAIHLKSIKVTRTPGISYVD